MTRRLFKAYLLTTCYLLSAPLWAESAKHITATGEEAARLTVRVAGLKPDKGDVAIAIFDSAETYNERSEPVHKTFLETGGQTVGEWRIADLPPGTYAVMAYQDVNGNRALDRRKMGIPKEPYGFSNDARGTFGPPSFEAAGFIYEGGELTIEFRVKGGL